MARLTATFCQLLPYRCSSYSVQGKRLDVNLIALFYVTLSHLGQKLSFWWKKIALWKICLAALCP